MSTASLAGARDHARRPGRDRGARHSARSPRTGAIDLPAGVAPTDVRWDETVAAGGYATHELPRGSVLRIADVEGDACVHLVVHHARATAERLNVADTVKVQWQAYLGPGAVLLSDMGRALMTIVADTSARHDALCGATSAAGPPQSVRRQRHPLGGADGPRAAHRRRRQARPASRDLPTGINLFKSAVVGGRRRAPTSTAHRGPAPTSSCAPTSTSS